MSSDGKAMGLLVVGSESALGVGTGVGADSGGGGLLLGRTRER